MNDLLLTPAQVAKMLSVTENTLHRWRKDRREIPYVTVGRNDIRYSQADVEAYIQAKRTPVRAAI